MTTLKIRGKGAGFYNYRSGWKYHFLYMIIKEKKLVLFFYPKASTPGCTLEACNLRDNYDRFKILGYEILGVSADSEKRQV